MIEITALGLLLIALGFYALITCRDLLRLIIGFNIVESGLFLLLVNFGYRRGALVPILGGPEGQSGVNLVDPLPQAFTLTGIVIGAAVTALLLSLAIKLHRFYGSLDLDHIRGLKG